MIKHDKPTGETVFYKLQASKIEKIHVKLPSTKPEVEDWILERALRSAARTGTPLFSGLQPERNPEDSFDYTIQAPDGPEYIDLMEVFILPKGTKGAHEMAASSYSPRELAEQIVDRVEGKSKHYGRVVRPLHLLLYSTDWRLHLRPPIAEVVAVVLNSRSHIFASITYFAPLDAEDGFVFRMFPLTPQELADFDRHARSIEHAIVG